MPRFSWLDYTVFGAYLLISVSFGLSLVKRKQSLNEFFLAGRNVNPFVVALTVLAALFSGISFLAGPAEVYRSGLGFAYVVLSFFIATPFTAIFVLPHFYNREFFTAYEFLEVRFARSLRMLASALFILRVLLWLAAATYAPALALQSVTGLPLWFTILCTGCITTLYTVFGGMKAVIWTDVMQLTVLFGGVLLIMSVAISRIPGGLASVWALNMADHRIGISLSLDPHARITLWSAIIGGCFLSLVQMATDQVAVQRYLTAGSLRDSQRSLWIKLWFILPVLATFYGAGLVLYAFYKGQGDPLALGQITKPDQILPFFVVTQLPAGLPGLLIAAIFSASMSAVSSGVNSLTSAVICDFYKPLTERHPLTEAQLLVRSRWFTVFFEVLVCALAFAISGLKSNLVESVNLVIGLVGGPLLGLFFLGIFSKRMRTPGALAGCLTGIAVMSTLFPSFAAGHPPFSFLWVTMCGCALTIVVGFTVNTLGRKKTGAGTS